MYGFIGDLFAFLYCRNELMEVIVCFHFLYVCSFWIFVPDDTPADFYLGQLQTVLRSVLNSNPPELEGNGAQSGEILLLSFTLHSWVCA